MKVVSMSKTEGDVNSALHGAVLGINKSLGRTRGRISKLECEIYVIPSGAYVSLMTVVNGEMSCQKEVLGVNIRGVSKDSSMEKATEKLNALLKDKNGDMVDMYSKTVQTLPGRAYTTMIAALNGALKVEKSGVKNASERRSRIKKTLELLDNSPSALNIARVAGIFGVSRTIIYRDLEALGFDRARDAEK